MGEYIKYQGEVIGLGTCENLYYVRFETLVNMVKTGATEKLVGNAKPNEYLDPKYGFRYRFPFPDEDGEEWYEDFDRGWRVQVPNVLGEEFNGSICIVQQKQVDNQLQVVVRDDDGRYCLPPEYAAKLAQTMLDTAVTETDIEMVARVVAGYMMDIPEFVE